MLDEPRHHTIEQDARITLGNKLQLTIFHLHHRKLLQVGLNEVPCRFWGGSPLGETLLQAAVRLVGGNHQVLLDGHRGGDSLEAALLFIECRDIGHYKTGLLHRRLQAIPHGSLSIGEHHSHPATGFKDTEVFRKAIGHQLSVVVHRFLSGAIFLGTVNNGIQLCLRHHAVPGLDQEIQFCVGHIFPTVGR